VHAAPDVSGAGLLRTQAPPSPARSPPRAAPTSAGSPGLGAPAHVIKCGAHGRSRHARGLRAQPAHGRSGRRGSTWRPASLSSSSCACSCREPCPGAGTLPGTLAVSCSATTGASERVGVPVYLRVAAPGAAWATEAGGAAAAPRGRRRVSCIRESVSAGSHLAPAPPRHRLQGRGGRPPAGGQAAGEAGRRRPRSSRRPDVGRCGET